MDVSGDRQKEHASKTAVFPAKEGETSQFLEARKESPWHREPRFRLGMENDIAKTERLRGMSKGAQTPRFKVQMPHRLCFWKQTQSSDGGPTCQGILLPANQDANPEPKNLPGIGVRANHFPQLA
jgi:hypothetical protein